MKLDKYLECFEELDEKLIDDAAPHYTEKRRLPARLIISAALVAVMLVLTFLTAYRLGESRKAPELPPQTEISNNHIIVSDKNISDNELETPTTTDMSLLEDKVDTTVNTGNDPAADIVDGLPVLTPELTVNGYGFEGMLVYDISELDKNDPFDLETELEALPVYNNLTYDIKTTQLGIFHLSDNEMKIIGEGIAKELRVEILSCEYEYITGIDYKFTSACKVICDDITILVNSSGGISFILKGDKTIPIPKGIIASKERVTPEEKQRIVDYLVNSYSEYLPCGKLIGGGAVDYTYSGEYIHNHNYKISDCYEYIPDDYVQSILNYNFRSYSFRLNEELTHVEWINIPGDYTAYTEKLGDYPVIGYEEALNSLCHGKYLTTVDVKSYINGEKVTLDRVHKAEIVYLTSSGNKIFMPYYKFYVLLDWRHEKSPEDLKNYGVFYVPAVSDEYLRVDDVVVNGQWGISNENT